MLSMGLINILDIFLSYFCIFAMKLMISNRDFELKFDRKCVKAAKKHLELRHYRPGSRLTCWRDVRIPKIANYVNRIKTVGNKNTIIVNKKSAALHLWNIVVDGTVTRCAVPSIHC